MTPVGILCIILGLMLSFAIAIGWRSPLCVVLFIYHMAASFLYWLYSLQEPADASKYYAAPYDPFTEIKVGTLFVRWLTASLRDLLDASYLDMFMLYHIAGYIGVVLLYQLYHRTMSSGDGGRPGYIVYLVAFLPGMHVWTSAIGKDGLVFLGICCFIWGASQSRPGSGFMLAGLALCALIRPHIAFLLAGSCAVSLALSSGIRLRWRLTLLSLLCASLWFGLPYLQEFLKLEGLSSTNVIDYVEQRQGENLGGGSSMDISDYSFPLQFFTFMYRPLFIDAKGILGLVVSLENLFYLIISVLFMPRIITSLFKGEDTFFLRFNFLYWAVGTAILAGTTANLGLAIRQKMMVVPSLIIMALTVYAKQQRDASTVADGEEPEFPSHLTNQA